MDAETARRRLVEDYGWVDRPESEWEQTLADVILGDGCVTVLSKSDDGKAHAAGSDDPTEIGLMLLSLIKRPVIERAS